MVWYVTTRVFRSASADTVEKIDAFEVEAEAKAFVRHTENPIVEVRKDDEKALAIYEVTEWKRRHD
jgi:hypothetical protein